MNKPKSKVVKSKSSNSAIITKTDNQRNKKSRSNAGFQTLMQVKKRGVYVEKKPTKVSLNNTATNSAQPQKEAIKPPPRPRPGQKKFLASVLKILSKSTTGTQYPDPRETIKRKKKLKDNEEVNVEKKKPKFRSKVLNNNQHQIDNFEVIQSKKEMIQTPSIYSECSNKDEEFKPWELGLPRLVKPDDEELQLEKERNISHLVKEVTEGRMMKANKIKIEDPATLVSDSKDDKGLYNFFVDLLETTFSVYNVKAEFDAAPEPSNKSSKVAFEIDENVAKKLTVAPAVYDDVTQKPLKRYYCLQNDGQEWNDDKLLDYFQSSPSSVKTHEHVKPKKRRVKSQSFAFTSQWQPPYTRSTVMSQKKSFYRKHNKRNLLNLLKEELKMDYYPFEEPQNLYQALQVMAKNKRKSQKSIRFDKSAKFDDDYEECMFKRRNVISSSTKSSKYKDIDYMRSTRKVSQRDSVISGYSRRQQPYDDTTEEEPSNHSLEVYGFEYEYSFKRTPEIKSKKDNELLFTYHSSPSDSDRDFNPYENIMKCDSRSEIQ